MTLYDYDRPENERYREGMREGLYRFANWGPEPGPKLNPWRYGPQQPKGNDMKIEINRPADMHRARLGIVWKFHQPGVGWTDADVKRAIDAAQHQFDRDQRDPATCYAAFRQWQNNPASGPSDEAVTWALAANQASMAATYRWQNPDAADAELTIIEEPAQKPVERAEAAKAPQQPPTRPSLASGLARAVAGYQDAETRLAVARQLLEEVVEAHKLDQIDNPPKTIPPGPSWVGALIPIIAAYLDALDKPAE